MNNARVEDGDEDHRPAVPKKTPERAWLSKGHKSFEKYQRAGVLHPRFEGRTWSSLNTEERTPFEHD